MQKPWENKSGLPDPTAYAAERNINIEKQEIADLVWILKKIAWWAGFEIINRMEFRDRRSGKVHR